MAEKPKAGGTKKPPDQDPVKPQVERFKEAARRAGADETGEAFGKIVPPRRPIAAADNFTVNESTTTVFDVVQNDSYSGDRSALRVTVVSQPALSGASATVRSDKSIDFVAPAVSSNQNTSFTYRIADARGTSNVVTVSVVVQNVAAGFEYITTPELWGYAPGNSDSANANAIRAAFAEASANHHLTTAAHGRGVVEFQPSTTYRMLPPASATTREDSAATVELANYPNTWGRTAGMPTGSTRALLQMTPVDRLSVSMFCVHSDSTTNLNVKLSHLRLDGNKYAHNMPTSTPPYSQVAGNNGSVWLIGFYGGNGVELDHLELFRSFVDGIAFDKKVTSPNLGATATNILIKNVNSHHNRRGNCMIFAGVTSATWHQIVFEDCRFDDAGDDSGSGLGAQGNLTAAGIDLEPPSGTNGPLHGITWRRCTFNSNGPARYTNVGTSALSPRGGRGLVFESFTDGATFRHIIVDNCTFNNNYGAAQFWQGREGVDFQNVRIYNSTFTNNDTSGNDGCNGIMFSAIHESPTVRTAYSDVILSNNNIPLIKFHPNMGSGHNFSIYRGNHNPTIQTNGATTVNTFPQGQFGPALP